MLRSAVIAALLALAFAGCGSGSAVVTSAETEGLYLDINGLKYQVQLSRYLNPASSEDSEYLIGLADDVEPPTGDETWFGVWVRVQNTSDEPRPSATTFEIHDTQENVYEPVDIDPEVNPFVYEPGIVPPETVWPLAESAPGEGPTQGLLLVYKLTNQTLQNRPLELIFSNGEGTQEGTYALDV